MARTNNLEIDVTRINKKDTVMGEKVKKGDLSYRIFKRCLDLVFSFLVLIILSWLLLIIAIIIKCTSKGPVFFLDQRIGKNGKKFILFKFRTMYSGAERNIHNYLSDEQYEKWIKERKLDDDPRITPVGRFLRRTSFDELPQIFNIIKGNMSVVGPRPITEIEIEENYTPEEKKKLLSCRPGLTSIWAVSGRSNITYESGERQQMELEYVDKKNMNLDLKLIFKTVGAVLKEEGAQ